MFIALLTYFAQTIQSLPTYGTQCDPTGGNFFALPHWYEYLSGQTDALTGKCTPIFNFPQDIWAVLLAFIDILLRVGGLLAVGYVVYGGFQYITSQGEPDRTASAKSTILNAVIGLAIVIIAITAVGFIGRTLG